MWKNTIPLILLQPPKGFNKKSQNTNGMLFLYPSKGAPVGLYILRENVHVHFIQDEKKAKKRVLNLHANICCCRNTATCFLLHDIKGTKKTSAEVLLQVVFKCIFEN